MKSKTSRLAACGVAAAAVLSSGCLFNSREVTVSCNDSLDAQREYYRDELISHDGLALESENFLRGNLMQSDLRSDSLMVLKRLNEFHKVSGDPKYLSIAADLCRYLATQVDEDEAIRYHLSCFYYCTAASRLYRQRIKSARSAQQLDESFSYDVTAIQGSQNYNEACNGIFSYLRKRNVLDATSIVLTDREGHRFVLEKPDFRLSVPREAVESFSLCASYEVRNLMQINRRPGVGVPLVATIREKQWYSSLKTPKGLTIPVTLSIRREDKDEGLGPIPLRLVFIDTCHQEVFDDAVGDADRIKTNMALDFSTPLACFLNNMTERNLLGKMLDSRDAEETDGLYMVEPYQPGKIPVVFIHGLMSSPETWVQMINSLKNDPNVRRRYQFWFFSYSTGAPVVLSAKELQESLLAAQREFCTTPEATANFNRMILVGHSMGGLLTRLMVQKDPHYLFETMLQTPWDELKSKLQPEDFQFLDSFVSYPLPFVHRAVFMAVPHKGADLAKSPIAKLGISLIKLPKSLVGHADAFARVSKALGPNCSSLTDGMGNDFYTGIDNLNPDNRFVRANGTSPMKDDLTYHCIIGNHDRAGAPDGSDGVVPYWSSHLDNAASELIVKSDHSVHRRPAAIQELLRILLVHLQAVDAKGDSPR